MNHAEAVNHTLTIVNALRRNLSSNNGRTTFTPIFYTCKRESLSLARSDTGFHGSVSGVDNDLKSTGAD
jgi:hypothetical protein